MKTRWWANTSWGLPLFLCRVAQAQGPAWQLARPARMLVLATMPALLLLLETTREGIYNILWGLVFAFATLNILSLGAKRFESNKGGLSFGEVLAIMVVLISILLLGWELLYQFQILPIRFAPE